MREASNWSGRSVADAVVKTPQRLAVAVDSPLDDVVPHEGGGRCEDSVSSTSGPGFAEPAAVVGVMKTVPANPIGRVRVPMVDENQAETVTDNEGVIRASGTTGKALKALAVCAGSSSEKRHPNRSQDQYPRKGHRFHPRGLQKASSTFSAVLAASKHWVLDFVETTAPDKSHLRPIFGAGPHAVRWPVGLSIPWLSAARWRKVSRYALVAL